MAITIKETFEVEAPVEAVWRFFMDPQQVAACMPGASLDEVVDERNFLGSIKVQVGAVTTSYKGKIQLTEVDEAAYTVLMAAEGRETGGGTAKGSMSSRLNALSATRTEVAAEAAASTSGTHAIRISASHTCCVSLHPVHRQSSCPRTQTRA